MSKKKKKSITDVLIRMKTGKKGTDLSVYMQTGGPQEQVAPVPLAEAIQVVEYVYNSLKAIKDKQDCELARKVTDEIVEEKKTEEV